MNRNVCVGTVGSGIWHSTDGVRWRQARMDLPFHAQPGEIQIRALGASHSDPRVLVAGSEVGLFRSEDGGARWAHLPGPFEGDQVWSVALDPRDPDTLLVGTKPPRLYRSRDAGKSWEALPLVTAKECFAGPPKLTVIAHDPRNPDVVWVGVEIDGVYRSDDGGDSWTHLPARGTNAINEDVHCLAISPGEPAKVHVTTPDGIWTSTDEGQSWDLHAFPRFYENRGISYCRGVALKPDDADVIFVANGNSVPGHIGAVQRSQDGGASWKPAELSQPPNSTIYGFATHPADPEFVVAHSLFGYLYTSQDAGRTFAKQEREFGEIRAVAWVPAS